MALPKLEVPTYMTTLPSTGKQISFRPFLVKEHKILLTITEADNEEIVRILKDLINVCTFKQLKINELPHFDIEYLFMQLRAKSISEVVEVLVTCQNCDQQYDASFNIEDLKVERKTTSNKIKITDKIYIELAYPKFEDVIELLENKNSDVVFNMVKNCMIGVYSENEFFDVEEQTNEEIEEFLYSLTKEQFENVGKFFEDSPKVVQEFDSTCTHCETVNKSRIEGIQNFFV